MAIFNMCADMCTASLAPYYRHASMLFQGDAGPTGPPGPVGETGYGFPGPKVLHTKG